MLSASVASIRDELFSFRMNRKGFFFFLGLISIARLNVNLNCNLNKSISLSMLRGLTEKELFYLHMIYQSAYYALEWFIWKV